jgi:transposase-like protein
MGRVRKKYPREFKLEAVRQLQSGEHSLSELSRRLGVNASDLCDWRKQVEHKKDDVFPGHGKQRGDAAAMAQLKRELEQVKEGRDILKKAMAFFARESR